MIVVFVDRILYWVVLVIELFLPLSAMFIDWFYRSKTLETAQIIGAILLLYSIILLSRDEKKSV